MATPSLKWAHAKSHKCPNLARLQIAYGAVGVCSQKVNEAVALVDGGVSDVLLSNQVVDAAKQRRQAAQEVAAIVNRTVAALAR